MFLKVIAALVMSSISFAQPKPATEVVKLTAKNTVMIYGEFDNQSVEAMMQQLVGGLVMAQKDVLNILMISPGGHTDSGARLAYFIDSIPAANVRLICIDCASAASHLFVTSKHERLMLAKSSLLMHEMKWVLPQYMITPKLIPEAKSQNDLFDSGYADRIGMPLTDYQARIRDAEWVVYGEEAVRLKFADRIVKIECDPLARSLFPNTCKPE